MLTYMNGAGSSPSRHIYVNNEKDGVQVEAGPAVVACDAYSDSILGFANNIRTGRWGHPYSRASKRCLTAPQHLCQKARQTAKKTPIPICPRETSAKGLTGLWLSVKVPDPGIRRPDQKPSSQHRGFVASLTRWWANR